MSIRRHSRAGVSKDCVRRHSYGVDVDAGAKTGYQHSVVYRAIRPELRSTGAAGRVPHTDGQPNGHTTHKDHAVRRRHRRSTPASGSRDLVHQYQALTPRRFTTKLLPRSSGYPVEIPTTNTYETRVAHHGFSHFDCRNMLPEEEGCSRPFQHQLLSAMVRICGARSGAFHHHVERGHFLG